jgi:general nucleoside transport system permease protein
MTINGVSLVDFAAVLLATGLLRAVPLVVAGIGEAVAERAGLLNLGIEGMMLSGCFFGFWAAYETDSLLIGMLAAVGSGIVLALLFGWLAITLKIDQILIGLAITIAGSGLTGYLFRDQFGGRNVAVDVDTSKIHVPWLKEIPVLGPALFEQQPLFYVSWALVPIVAWVLFRTRFGLQVRGAGETPVAVDAAGVSVERVRYVAIAIGGALAGFAGGFLCVADVGIFTTNMTVGQGFIALALAMVGNWSPWRIAVGAIVFGVLRSMGDGLQILGVNTRPEFLAMLPYLGVIVAMVLLAGRTRLPSALATPYRRGMR